MVDSLTNFESVSLFVLGCARIGCALATIDLVGDNREVCTSLQLRVILRSYSPVYKCKMISLSTGLRAQCDGDFLSLVTIGCP